MMDLSAVFSQHVANTTYAALPAEAARAARSAIIDSVAAILAGADAPGIASVVDLVGSWTGRSEALIPFVNQPVSAVAAAWATGAMARARDIDDVHDATGDHPGIGAVVGALVAAQAKGGVPLEDLVVAVALGVDVVLRLRAGGRTPPAELPWTTGTYAPLAAAVAAAKIWGLDAQCLRHALGIGFTTMSNTRQPSLDGALAHRVHHGLAISNGIAAVKLAMSGITGPRDSIEGPWGYYRAFEHGDYDREAVIQGLGEFFRGVEVRIKLYPCCAHTHFAIQNTISMAAEENVSPADVKEVVAFINERGYKSVCSPLETKVRPQSPVDAQWSLPFVTAVALARKDVFVGDLTEDAIRDEAILRLAAKVRPAITRQPNDERVTIQRCPIEIRLLDGRVLRSDLVALKGSPERPLTESELYEKLEKCARLAPVPPSPSALQTFFEGVLHENDRNVAELVGGLW